MGGVAPDGVFAPYRSRKRAGRTLVSRQGLCVQPVDRPGFARSHAHDASNPPENVVVAATPSPGHAASKRRCRLRRRRSTTALRILVFFHDNEAIPCKRRNRRLCRTRGWNRVHRTQAARRHDKKSQRHFMAFTADRHINPWAGFEPCQGCPRPSKPPVL